MLCGNVYCIIKRLLGNKKEKEKKKLNQFPVSDCSTCFFYYHNCSESEVRMNSLVELHLSKDKETKESTRLKLCVEIFSPDLWEY